MLMVAVWMLGLAPLEDVQRSGGPKVVFEVTGTVELDRAAAERTARLAARDRVRQSLARTVDRLVRDRAPAWLPAVVRWAARDRWLRAQDLTRFLHVVERRTTVRDHGYARSFQTRLRVRVDEGAEAAARAYFTAERLGGLGRALVAKGSGVLLFWGVLGAVYMWLDRLSRGYMTWRLRFLTLAVGLAVPGLLTMI